MYVLDAANSQKLNISYHILTDFLMFEMLSVNLDRNIMEKNNFFLDLFEIDPDAIIIFKNTQKWSDISSILDYIKNPCLVIGKDIKIDIVNSHNISDKIIDCPEFYTMDIDCHSLKWAKSDLTNITNSSIIRY